MENKVKLKKLLKETAHLQQTEFIYCEGHVSKSFTSRKDENDFAFQQVEADTMILSTYAKLREYYNGTVIINSEDTDLYVQGAYVAHNLQGNLIKNKNTLFKCTDLVTGNISNMLLQFHVITLYNHRPGFEKLQKDQEAQHLLQKVGEYLELSDNVGDNMRRFMLLKIYGGKETTCTEGRAPKWRKTKKKIYVRLPPDEDTLHHHLDKVNYLSYLLNRHPSPIGHGWEHIKGKCPPAQYAVPENS